MCRAHDRRPPSRRGGPRRRPVRRFGTAGSEIRRFPTLTFAFAFGGEGGGGDGGGGGGAHPAARLEAAPQSLGLLDDVPADIDQLRLTR